MAALLGDISKVGAPVDMLDHAERHAAQMLVSRQTKHLQILALGSKLRRRAWQPQVMADGTRPPALGAFDVSSSVRATGKRLRHSSIHFHSFWN